MRRTMLALALLATAAASASTEEAQPNPELVLRDLAIANRQLDRTRIASLLESIREIGHATRNPSVVDPLARELTKSLKVCKRDGGTQLDVVHALGELRSKPGAAALKRLAFRKKVKKEREAALQAAAIQALSRMQEKSFVRGFIEQAKSRNLLVASAAYDSLASYSEAPGRLRKEITEFLVKRLALEYPAYSQSSGKWISEEKQQRWREVSPRIVASLQAVTGESSISAVDDWNMWWNENKSRPKAWKRKPVS
ncbi:MAG: hypothetical protein ACYSUN_01550 [Planctomycetota bacterium]